MSRVPGSDPKGTEAMGREQGKGWSAVKTGSADGRIEEKQQQGWPWHGASGSDHLATLHGLCSKHQFTPGKVSAFTSSPAFPA